MHRREEKVAMKGKLVEAKRFAGRGHEASSALGRSWNDSPGVRQPAALMEIIFDKCNEYSVATQKYLQEILIHAEVLFHKMQN